MVMATRLFPTMVTQLEVVSSQQASCLSLHPLATIIATVQSTEAITRLLVLLATADFASLFCTEQDNP
jgi:hypothetical protein